MDNLTVVIPFCDGHATIGALLDSISADVPVVIVDDVSDTPIQVERPNTRVIRLAEKGYFAGACNVGIGACSTDVLVLNQDVHFTNDLWQGLVYNAKQNGNAIAGDGVFDHPAWPGGYVQGTFMYMSRAAIKKIGLLNQADYPLWGCTCEWQLRACRAGFTARPVSGIPGFAHKRRGGIGTSIRRQLDREPAKKNLFIRTPPAITIVIPCYNYGRFLQDAVNSLIGGETSLGVMKPQTFQSFEIIIVDDCSTDNSAEIGASLADPMKGIRFIKRAQNGGTPAANNTGMEAAYGKYLTHLSADDMRESWSLEAMYRASEENPGALVYDDIVHAENGKRTYNWEMLDYDFERLLNKNYIHAGVMFRKVDWQQIGGYPSLMTKGREDWAFNVAMGIAGHCGYHVKRPGYIYRQHGRNRHFDNAGQGWRTFFVGQMKKLFPKIYDGERPMACCGGGAKVAPATKGASKSNAALPGASGMVLIEYIGANTAPTTWYGPVTSVQYQFGGRRKVGYVDKSDAPGMLEIIQNKQRVFKPYKKAAEPKLEEKAPKAPEPARQVFDFDANVVLDQNARTVNAFIDEHLGDMNADQIKALYDAESAGKARKLVLSHLDEVMAHA